MRRALLAFILALGLTETAQAERRRRVEGLCAPPSDNSVLPTEDDTGAPPPALIPGPPPALEPVPPLVVSRVSKAGRRVALTFDACSAKHCSQYDERITQVLKETETPATIFIGGKWAAEQRIHVRELAALPNIELGNHTWSHPPMPRVDASRRKDELLKTQAEVFSLTGKQPTLFRPPYGQYNEEIVKDAAKLGLTTVEYDVASGDPDRNATKERLVRWVLGRIRPGSIVVMHINRRGWHTAEALPEIIAGLKKRRYELVTVGELLKNGAPDPAALSVMNVAGRPPKRQQPTAAIPHETAAVHH